MKEKDITLGAEASEKRSGKGKSAVIVIFAVLFLLSALCLFLCAIYYQGRLDKLRKEKEAESSKAQEVISQTSGTYTDSEVEEMLEQQLQQATEQIREDFLNELQEQMLSGNGTVNMLRHFFTDKIVFAANGGFVFLDIEDSLEKHPYVNENLVIDENTKRYSYVDGDQTVSHMGIDVSSFQGDIDWKKVRADGVEFAMIRMGIRGYGKNGVLVPDKQFDKNIQGAISAGVDVGVYFFTQALTPQEAEEEADMVIEALIPYGLGRTVAIDVENVGVSDARTNVLTQEQWTENTLAFLKKIEAAGFRPMIYGNMEALLLLLDIKQIEQYPKWFAAYMPYFYFPYQFRIWQYTDKGRVNGINGAVDLNISFYDFSLRPQE